MTYGRCCGAEFCTAVCVDCGRGMDPRVKPKDDESARAGARGRP
jgi:hypothetical protein